MKKIIGIVVFLTCIGLSHAVTCYVCSGTGQCADPFDPSAPGIIAYECSYGYICAKISVVGPGQLDQGVTRGCASRGTCEKGGIVDDCIKEYYGNQRAVGCCCTTSLCNAAIANEVNLVTIVAMLVVTGWFV
ncbi:uncharacterized protein LOC110982368 [Acanthaster planci]|uniref:Uncharacterized protein LOC110982368 n=1 Tax=Acanthaster planci TaxID=133434 RepID=A0A8B7YSZ8_ACAPL|nr:uncharacterized protein LOC110982368 [Acanthaster planci]